MMKKILGLDIGTNSIGWALIEQNFEEKKGKIIDAGVRIIPMGQDVLGKFDAGVKWSRTEDRTRYRSMRRLRQRHLLRRERLHRVLNILGFLPKHYSDQIDFESRPGQFKFGKEPKIAYMKDSQDKYEFVFKGSFEELTEEMKKHHPELFDINIEGKRKQIPADWTIYYLRKKALSQAITKAELAWLLLHFNQKRGYYQIRGEEGNEDDEKDKTYEVLKVERLEETTEAVKGNKLYEIYFENGWVYDKKTTKPDIWLGKEKEFIVTTTTTKGGDLKRTFKEVDSEKDWLAIKKKTEQDIIRSDQTVGEFIYNTLLHDPSCKIRGKLIKTIERKFYKQELQRILKVQSKYHQEFSDSKLYDACIEELYPRNEAHKKNIQDKDLIYLLLEDILFYQRPLKSKKSTISNCQYEARTFLQDEKKTTRPLKGIPKSHPLYQEFRLWQFLQTLRIYRKERKAGIEVKLDEDVTSLLLTKESDWVELFEFLSEKKEIEQKDILNFLIKTGRIEKKTKDTYRWNFPEDKKYPAYSTRAEFISKLKKVPGINPENFFDNEKVFHLWHIVYSVRDQREFAGEFNHNGSWLRGGALASFARKYGLDQKSFVDAFKNFPPFDSEYGSYSVKAIKKLLPLMRQGKYWNESEIHQETKDRIEKIIDGECDEKITDRTREKAVKLNKIEDFKGLPLWLTCYIVYGRHSEARDIAKWRIPEDVATYLKEFKQHSLRNPIVEQVVTETLRVVKDIWEFHGKGRENFFDEIHVELGRQMKNPKDKRKDISQRQQENENTNQRIRMLLTEMLNDSEIEGEVRPHSPFQQQTLKIYEQGVFENSQEVYKGVSTDEIDKIRKKTSPSTSEIARYKLWLEQGYISPYTGKVIPLSKLFTTAYQIEHIIPQARYFDDSLNNKVICESEVNDLKGNKTALEFIKDPGLKRVPTAGGKYVEILDLSAYEDHCTKYFAKNRSKLKNLLSEEIPEGYIERQLNDTRYISRFVSGILSNIVRQENEQEVMSKNLIPVTGGVTDRLKRDWGLNDKWNEIIAPRFKRLNELTNSDKYGYFDTQINAFRITVPEEIQKGFSKKRIDHRHHAMDAIVIACATRNHVNYLNNETHIRKGKSKEERRKLRYDLRDKLRKIEKIQIIDKITGEAKKISVAREFLLPWLGFPVEVKQSLETIIISFKQNLRVINKATNNYWKWVEENGKWKKKLVHQKKGDSWAIRKALHKETVSGVFDTQTAGLTDVNIPKGQVATATRIALTGIQNQKHIDKIADFQLREVIIPNHLKKYSKPDSKPNFEEAFNADGVEALNENIKELNNGKLHKPVYRVRVFEIGSKFPVSENDNTQNKKNSALNQARKKRHGKAGKFVEAAKGTNLFFAIYVNKENGERNFKTIPLFEVIEHQKQEAHLPKEKRTGIPIDPEGGSLLFSLSPNDLVYVPTEEELHNRNDLDFSNLKPSQVRRIYKMVSTTQNKCHFVPIHTAQEIEKNENGTNSKDERMQDFFDGTCNYETEDKPVMIKSRGWKLKINRLGKILAVNT